MPPCAVESKDEAEKPKVSVVTTEAYQTMGKVHDRMPVILGSQNAAMAWLRDDEKDSVALRFLRSYDGSSATFNAYRRKFKRLCQWS